MKGPGLTFKLIAFILMSTTVIFCTAFYYGHLATKDVVFGLVEENARHLTSATINEIETVLRGIEKITLQTTSLIEKYSYTQEDLFHLITSAVSSNPEIFGSAIAFQPYAFDPEVYYYSPYCFQEKSDQTRLTVLGSEDYDYFSMDWYRRPMELNKPVWSEPYYDEGGGNIIMATFSAPFYKNINGVRTFQGVVTADISLAWLRKIVSAIKIYDTGYAFLISQKGFFVTHPNEQFIMRENIFNLSEARGDQKAVKVGRYMVRGGQGFVPYRPYLSGKQSWMYYAAVPATGWSLAVIFPEDELFASTHELARKVILVALVGFALLLVVIAFIARTIIKPVRYLASTTQEIARGNLDIELPLPTSDDEIAALTHSFIEMKTALKVYISNLAETTAAKERIESELKIARAIQMSFLPKHFPPFSQKEAIEIYAGLEPAREIGGDFYDFFLLDDNQLFFTIGDVSGKGIPAALFMAVTKTLIKGIAGSDADLSEVVRKVNQELCLDNEAMMFTTVFCGILNFNSGELRYTNAGHLPPLLVRPVNGPEWLELPQGTALAVDEGARYQTQTTVLEPGDSIILYTDGVTESINEQLQLYSAERLLATVRLSGVKSSEEYVRVIFDSVRTHASGMPPSDDITVLAVAFRHFQK